MKNISLLLLLFCLGKSSLFAQKHFHCGNEAFSQMIHDRYPVLEQAFNKTFENAKNHTVQNRSPLTVHLVFHVIWKNPEENLHDSILQKQVAIINRDFNRLNPDSVNLRAVFQPKAGKADINFVLDQVVRVQTTKDFEFDPFGGTIFLDVKTTTLGGSDAVDPEHYINIWICKIQESLFFGQILGLAFPPNNLGNWPPDSGAPTPGEDGVLLDFRIISDNNPNIIFDPFTGDPLVVKGRTAVHELGHYLGLRHIWGDGGTFGPNDCDQSDGIDDTPYANSESAFDCDQSRNTCSQVEGAYGLNPPDMIENYMDYSAETCTNTFTKGQVGLMRSVVETVRSGLLEPVSGVNVPEAVAGICIFPNPAANAITASLGDASNAPSTLRLLDLQGRELLRADAATLGDGQGRYTIPLHSVPSGPVVLEMIGERGAVAKMFQKL